MTIVDYDDLESALMWVSDGGLGGNQAYVALDTGKIYWTSEYNDVEVEEDRPDDLETSDRYVMLPHKNELDLGRDLVQRFVTELLPKHSDEIDSMFCRKGAYARFKNFLDAKAKLDEWHRFEAEAQEDVLRAWCSDNGLEMVNARSVRTVSPAPVQPVIRPVAVADAAAICAIYNPYVLDTTISFEQSSVSVADMAKRVTEYTALYPWLVAEVDAKIVAYAYATRWRTRAAYDHTLESTIYVDKAWIGRGVAKPLYLELLRQLQARGAHAVLGCIALPNDASVALHERCGFVKVAHFPQVGLKFERWVDVGFWQVTLSA